MFLDVLALNLFCCRECSNRITELFDADRSIQKLFTPSRCYMSVRSRYASTNSVATSQLNPAQLLGQNVSSSTERSQLKEKLETIEKVDISMNSSVSAILIGIGAQYRARREAFEAD